MDIQEYERIKRNLEENKTKLDRMEGHLEKLCEDLKKMGVDYTSAHEKVHELDGALANLEVEFKGKLEEFRRVFDGVLGQSEGATEPEDGGT